MKYSFLFVFLLCSILAIDTFGQEKVPIISFNITELNYGEIVKKSDGKRNFVVSNHGDAPLLIKSCSGSCGCTVPTCPLEPIMPHKSSSIEVKYDTQRLGPFQKTITVYSNDPKTPVCTLRIKGEIKE